jgi:hypothetical protein
MKKIDLIKMETNNLKFMLICLKVSDVCIFYKEKILNKRNILKKIDLILT